MAMALNCAIYSARNSQWRHLRKNMEKFSNRLYSNFFLEVGIDFY